jgi:hypothetical protein
MAECRRGGVIAHPALGFFEPVKFNLTKRAYGFGLDFAVRLAVGKSPVPGSVGEYFSSGVTGTYCGAYAR